MVCSNCDGSIQDNDKFCSHCGVQQNVEQVSISTGKKSINTVDSEINNSSIHVGDTYVDTNNIDPEILNLKRHFVSLPWSEKGKVATKASLLKLGTLGSIASIIGLFSQFFTSSNNISIIFIISFAISMFFLMVAFILKRFRFSHLVGKKSLEIGNKDTVFLTETTCDCPWCGSEMKLKMIGPKDYKEHMLLCDRNPSQHRIRFDATVMPDINE